MQSRVRSRMMNGIENFLNVKAPPQASISFEVIAEATCDPPAIKEKIVTEQPLKFWVTKEKRSRNSVLGPMSPLPTMKDALLQRIGNRHGFGRTTESHRWIKGGVSVSTVCEEGKCHMIVASHTDESRDQITSISSSQLHLRRPSKIGSPPC
ncbi:unnamed protein product [Caenorhabditis nigoni]